MQPVYLDEILSSAEMDFIQEVRAHPSIRCSKAIFYPSAKLLDLGLIRVVQSTDRFMVYNCTDKVAI